MGPVAQFPYGTPVLGGRSVQRYGGQDAPYVARPVPGELLQHAPHFTAVGQDQRFGPAQSAAHLGHRGERAGLATELVAVEPLVGEVDEHHERFAVDQGSGPGVAAVLDDPAAHVPRGRQYRLLGAVGAPADQGAAPALGGSGLGPPHLVPDEAQVLGVPVVRGGEGRVDGRGPGTVRQGLHVLPQLRYAVRRKRSRTRTPKCRASTGTRSSTPWKRAW